MRANIGGSALPALAVLARDLGDELRAMSGEGWDRVSFPQSLMPGLEAAGDNPDRVAVEIEHAGDVQRIGRHRVTVGVLGDIRRRTDHDQQLECQVRRCDLDRTEARQSLGASYGILGISA